MRVDRSGASVTPWSTKRDGRAEGTGGSTGRLDRVHRVGPSERRSAPRFLPKILMGDLKLTSPRRETVSSRVEITTWLE